MPLTISSFPKQLSDGNGVQGGPGTLLGTGPSDKIGFYGDTTPSVQPSGVSQAAVGRGLQLGTIATFGSIATPLTTGTAGAPGSTTIEFSISAVIPTSALFKVATTDLIFINKPTSQAGLGVGNVRGSAANGVGVTFSNLTAVTITPTATEKYGVIAIRGMPSVSQVLTPASVAAGTTIEQQFTVVGLRVGDLVQVNKPSAQAGLDIVGCRVAGNNTLGITYMNCSVAAITPTSEAYVIFGMGGLDAVNNRLLVQQYMSVAVDNGANNSKEVTFVCTGLQLTDAVVGISKPTSQAGLGIYGQRAQSSANALSITYANVSAATITLTTAEVYSVLVDRPNPAAPLVVYAQALTPSIVAGLTSVEQTFTVTGVVANSAAWVNKPSFQAGLGIAGVRVSAANQIAINYVNTTTTSITPTAGEVYLIGNFQQTVPDGSNSFAQTASPVDQAQSTLANALRSALGPTGTNLIAGA